MTSMKKRVIRVLEYYGDASWVDSTMAQNAVKGYQQVGKNYIREVAVLVSSEPDTGIDLEKLHDSLTAVLRDSD